MNHKWWIVVAVLGWAACSGDSGEGKDWKLSEEDNNASITEDQDDANNDDDSANNEDNSANNEDNLNNQTIANNENNLNNQTIANNLNNTNSTNNQTNNNSCLPHEPVSHRPLAETCAAGRGPGTTPEFEGDWECQTDDDCSGGRNGRCTGNSHDGWYCTYDACDNDSECGSGDVCECEGGFRSDHNVCLPGNCTTDSDCATGFCSPSQGTCGAYFGTVGYFCHTCEDECINDADCGDDASPWGSYCMYDQGVGHWRCSDSQCAG